ncbi:MAG: PcfJ domain-containing protein [Lachnospiraceae bacterium]|nr:PcfJ domain-containing protein [Lachnospiraceae bacterium]
MKKKQIEKIPYITVPRIKKSKKIKYVAVTALEELGNEPHILLEVYRNRKDSLNIPAVRYTATRKDWCVFFPEKGEWNRQGILSGERFCWQDVKEHSEEGNTLCSQEDMDRIREFFDGIAIWRDSEWWDYFRRNENAIKIAERQRKDQRREERLNERIGNTPPLKEQELLEWSERAVFKRHFLYYRKKGRRAAVCCSKCGGVAEGIWKTGEPYESQFERRIMEPVRGCIGYCSLCGTQGIYQPQGKSRNVPQIRQYVFLADRYHDQGVALRYIQLEKDYILEELVGEDGQLEMMRAYEKTNIDEIARTYFIPGQKTQTDYHKYSPYTGRNFWHDCNLYGHVNIRITEGLVYPDTWKNLKGTFLQYSGMQEYAQSTGGILNAKDYLERYLRVPQMEMLSKMKLYGIVKGIMENQYYSIVRCNMAKRPDLFLGIKAERVKILIKSGGDVKMLHVLQMERDMKQNWTEKQIRDLAEIDPAQGNLEMAAGFMSIQKMLNAISKYAGCGYGSGCSMAEERLKNTAGTYFDYLSMRRQLGYDLSNTVYQRPRDLHTAHVTMIAEMNREKEDQRITAAETAFPGIRKNYRKLRKRYFYRDGDFQIRPARSAGEIILEGRILHHCVGGDNYLRKHDRGISYILMLRRTEEPEIPYITVEINDDFQIIQWYGAHDKKPDKENMQFWLDGYVKALRNPERETGTQTAETAQMAAAAGA